MLISVNEYGVKFREITRSEFIRCDVRIAGWSSRGRVDIYSTAQKYPNRKRVRNAFVNAFHLSSNSRSATTGTHPRDAFL